MVSFAEKIASNIGVDDLKKSNVLRQRILFTIIMLIIYRIGAFIPLPGVNASALSDMFTNQGTGKGILDMFNVFTGGSLSRMTIFALNVMPYISASIIISLMSSVTPSLAQLKKEGESGRAKLNQYTRYLTVLICGVQAYGISAWLGSIPNAVINPGFGFVFTTIISLIAGTMLVMWMGEQITARGIGQGTSLIIFIGIITNLPMSIAKTIELGKVGQIQPILILAIIAVAIAAIYFICSVEMAQRRVLVHYPNRGGHAMAGQDNTHMPLKLNSAGVIPAIFASSLIGIPGFILNFVSKSGNSSETLQTIATYLRPGSAVYMLIFASLIAFFSFFYTAVQFNSEETAENLKNYGGFIPGVRPGAATATYLDYVLTRITVFGAFYLVVICLLPDFLIYRLNVPFYLGGTSLLIVCSVVMDTVTQIQSHLISAQYEALVKSAGKMKKRFRK